jgi:uncharacterized repeat protein (TIGR03803 family)
MRPENFSIALAAALLTLAVTLMTSIVAVAQTEEVIHSFNIKNGEEPYAGLIFDSSGNLYGTTLSGGGGDSIGTVFELTPKASGGWTENILHRFKDNSTDGYNPYAGLVFDSSGNLYGTTSLGGTHNDGVVFELTPKVGGGWTERILHNFGDNASFTDGEQPLAGLVFDSSGNLYGTTSLGGTYGGGTTFELTPKADGGWTERILHNFYDNVSFTDGFQPNGGLIFDGDGNLYGTTLYGGSGTCSDSGQVVGCGTTFELSPKADGGWQERILYSFQDNSTDGNYPYASLIFDSVGNLFGTTDFGGAHGSGTAFELMPTASGSWTEQVVYSFGEPGGTQPRASLVLDAAGNLYGTTSQGNGTVFELTPAAGGTWTETTLHTFTGKLGHDGSGPFSNLIFDSSDNLYGTTASGGAYGNVNYGTVFEITP